MNYFDKENHKYYVDGVEKPSVTDIIAPVSFQRLNAINESILRQASQRGSICHELFEQYFTVGEINPDDVPPECVPYVQQFLLWAKTYRPKPIYCEKTIFFDSFCGTIDLICEIDGETCIVDYKTTSAIDKKSLSVQLAGYKFLVCNELDISPACFYLHLKKDSYSFKRIIPDAGWFGILLAHNEKMREKI